RHSRAFDSTNLPSRKSFTVGTAWDADLGLAAMEISLLIRQFYNVGHAALLDLDRLSRPRPRDGAGGAAQLSGPLVGGQPGERLGDEHLPAGKLPFHGSLRLRRLGEPPVGGHAYRDVESHVHLGNRRPLHPLRIAVFQL